MNLENKAGAGLIQSIKRAVDVLKCFETHISLGVTEISKMLSLHKSTAFGIINTLEKCGLLEKNEASSKYSLGMELFRLGSNININIREICAPHLKQIVESTGETVNLVMRSGENVIYLDKVESPYSMRICTRIGQQYPMYCTAVGKAILAFLDASESGEILSRIQLIAFTENTITDKNKLKEQFEKIRQNGYAIDMEEMEYGLICVAVPVLNTSGSPVASISVSGPAVRMNDETKRKVSDLLLRHSKEISKKLN